MATGPNSERYKMKKVLKFLSWWWNRRSTDERIATVLLSLVTLFLPAGFIFGVKGVLAVLLLILAVVVSLLLFGIYCLVRQQWDKFNRHVEEEEQKVISRLRGDW